MADLKPDGNYLFYGDNLDVMQRYIPDNYVDLVYLDPPFKSNQDYNVLFEEKDGSQSAAQILAFEDTWHWDLESRSTFDAMTAAEQLNRGGVHTQIAKTLLGLRSFLGTNDMMAYITMMAPRLLELRRVMKPTASIYLHCDPTASHYLKVLMDAVFGKECYINEIIWHYRKWPSGKFTFQRNHDIIFFYSKTNARERVFNQQYMPRAESTLKRFGDARIISAYDAAGKRIPSQKAEDSSAGVRQDDVWDIGRVPPIKQLFPTQKPDDLLRRIIESSSNIGDTILDPFCGCGTTVISAQELERRWLGIDITHLAIGLIKYRLYSAYGDKAMYGIIGEPVDLTSAKALADADKYQFQYWALGLVGARPFEQKKGADRGIDGVLYFEPEGPSGAKEKIMISVKGGHVQSSHIRDLRGVIDREEAKIGVLITLNPPTREMTREASEVGFYRPKGMYEGEFPRIQILTIEELLNGARIDFPGWGSGNTTHRRAPKAVGKRKDVKTEKLELE